MYAHLERDPTPLRSLRADVPEIVERLVLDLLAKDPEARPDGADEVYRRLQPLLPRSAQVPADGDPLDPTQPYRRPLAPPPRARRADVAAVRRHVTLARGPRPGRSNSPRRAGSPRLPSCSPGGSAAPSSDRPIFVMRGFQLAHTLLLGGEFGRALPEFQRSPPR